jgi:uncharacterized membrane protein YwzB
MLGIVGVGLRVSSVNLSVILVFLAVVMGVVICSVFVSYGAVQDTSDNTMVIVKRKIAVILSSFLLEQLR